MKVKWLCLASLLVILAGCRKKENIAPSNPGNPTTGQSTFSMSELLQSNMVVQRDKPFAIWGKAPARLKIVVNVSWNITTFNTVADASGNWTVSVPGTAANASPQTIIAKADGFDAVILTNVVIGDVWICSGQSNMAYPVDSIAPFEGVVNYKTEIAAANYPFIRVLAVQDDYEATPAANLHFPVTWSVCSPATVGKMSAIAYYFAQKLNVSLNIPIGIIISAVNGSWCQNWTNVDAIQSDPVLSAKYLAGSSALYNGKINLLINLSVKGFIWYQGENNQHDNPPADYTRLNSALIQGWRTNFNQAALPFYYVQLTPFAEDYNSTNPVGGDLTSDYLALFREAQANIRAVPGTEMAITMDVGEPANHHPRNKKPVGERLALLALNHTYGQNVQCLGPQYAAFAANQYTVVVNFVAGTATGLNTIGNNPLNQFFFVAGTDHLFRQGAATISGNTIIITAPQNTPLPIQAVRYAFTNAPVTNLQNSAGLPAEPFRTDNWSN
ncbi:MAG TPA: sialate O-acetylesterase [Mucilaginibacter sp.]